MKSRLWVGLALAVTGLYRCTSVIRMVISSNSLFGRSSSCLKQKGGGALHCRRLMMAPTRLANAASLALIRLTNAASQLPYGSGETKGELVLRTHASRKEKESILGTYTDTFLIAQAVSTWQAMIEQGRKIGRAS